MPILANAVQFAVGGSAFQIRNPQPSGHQYIPDAKYFGSPPFGEFRSDRPWLTLGKLREGLREAKLRFLRGGFATYQDIEYICSELVSDEWLSRRLAARFPLMIVDECQDLSEAELAILGKLRATGVVLHFVGDMNQAIYSFKGVDPAKVEAFVQDNGFAELRLSDNFRSLSADRRRVQLTHW